MIWMNKGLDNGFWACLMECLYKRQYMLVADLAIFVTNILHLLTRAEVTNTMQLYGWKVQP